MTTNSVLALMPTSKESIKNFANMTIASIVDGNADALSVHVQLTAMEQVIKSIKSDSKVKELAISEAVKWAKQKTDFGSVDVRESAVKYDFSVCGHTDYDYICAKIQDLESQKKDFEDTLKTIKTPVTIVLKDGEIKEIQPPVKTSSKSIVVTFK